MQLGWHSLGFGGWEFIFILPTFAYITLPICSSTMRLLLSMEDGLE